MARGRKPRIWALLGVLLLLAVPATSQRPSEESLAPVQEETQLSTTPPAHDDNSQAANSERATHLVTEALNILRTLDPSPVRPSAREDLTLAGKALHFARQAATVVLVHSPASLEEPVEQQQQPPSSPPPPPSSPPPPPSSSQPQQPQQQQQTPLGGNGLFGKKLRDAVEKLESAREIAGSYDAIYLLAQMNFYGNWSHPRDYKVAFERYKELADLSGNATAQSVVGFMYATGIGGGVGRDQAKALLYHTFAALNGDTRSEMTVAFRHHTGIGTARHCEDAAFYYKRVADKAIDYWRSGPPGGHHLIKNAFRLADDEGGVYGEGASVVSSGMNAVRRGTTDTGKDLDDIIEYLDLMARKGDLSATFTLAKLYYDGSRNLPRDLRKAKMYFTDVARQYWTREGKPISSGLPGVERLAGKAAGYIGKMYLRAEGVAQDFTQAGKWFRRGIQNGDASSQNGLGFMYLHGYGLKIDRQRAADFFQEAVEQDLPQAQINLGKLFLEQSELEVAKRYFELAARHGTLEAYYYLAEIYNSGHGKERSCSLATAYYKLVAERVEPLQSPLAWANKAFQDGDTESALIGYMMAAEQGYEVAQANVAYLLDEEKSRLPLSHLLLLAPPPRKDPARQELALMYWTRSAKQANTDSLVKMGDYYLSGIGTDADPEKAASCYQAASELQASAQALWNLGWMHENGVGVEQDFHLAKRYYDHALETNQEAYLPVTLSLLKLRVRSAWNTLSGGGINAIGADPAPTTPRPTLREFLKKWYEATPDDYADGDDIYGTSGAAGAAGGGDDDLDLDLDMDAGGAGVPQGEEYYDAGFDDDVVESILILALAAAVAVLVYYRQQRQQGARRREQEAAAAAAAAAAGRGGQGVGGVAQGLGLGLGQQGQQGQQDFQVPWGVPH